jgi:hypothetical protein
MNDSNCQRRLKTARSVLGGDDLLGSAFESVAVALEDDDLGAVDKAVDHGSDRDGIAEDLGPGGERLVGAHDEAGSFVAG